MLLADRDDKDRIIEIVQEDAADLFPLIFVKDPDFSGGFMIIEDLAYPSNRTCTLLMHLV